MAPIATTRRALLADAAIATASLAGPRAAPAGTETVLRWAGAGGAPTFDPHSLNTVPAIAQWWQVYEGLLDLDSSLHLIPQLAVACRPLDRLTWEIRLREGVHFHDGAPLTSEDVVFSLERARTEPSELRVLFRGVEAITADDANTVRIRTAAPAPALPQRILGNLIGIVSKSWAEAHGAARAADFKAGAENFASRHANGTGPFVLEEFEPGGRIAMRRNPAWWGAADYPLNIDRLEYTPIADPQQRLDALLRGELDLLTDPPFDGLDRIRATPGLKLVQAMELRTIFLGMDQGSAELRSSEVRGKNPFRDRRVRRALYQAIDIEAIRRDVMRGLARPAGIMIPTGVTGYTEELDQRLPYDPEAAKRLLAEAGYPEGFGITLDCPNNRYINDEAICRAVAAQLARVGVRVRVDAQPWARHLAKPSNRQTDFYLFGYGGQEAEELLLQFYYSQASSFNATGYVNPRADELIDAVVGEAVSYIHDAQLEEVWRLVLDDIVYLPLHQQVIVWAMREELDLPLNPINFPLFRDARFSKPLARTR
jgi:peptide/nickel transport system substrate-binding protein